jgi:hypothetical protein
MRIFRRKQLKIHPKLMFEFLRLIFRSKLVQEPPKSPMEAEPEHSA